MNVMEATDANFQQLLAEHDKVVVKYYADWCGHCRLFAPRYEHLAEQYPGLTFVKVNAETNPLARRLGQVHDLPFFAAFREGQLVDFLSTMQEQDVAGLLDSLQATLWPQ
ncbi:thioredoxin [Hymenobacter saemangeumensis]|uniref:Thioredoxin n=1 Tax=Hymenobacter saemangeumensis TaxID=1084522 RepID=A0ABP8IFV5_9BACT